MVGILLRPLLILTPSIFFPHISSSLTLFLTESKSWPDAREEQYCSSRLHRESRDFNLLAFYVHCTRIQDASEVARNLVITYDEACSQFSIRKCFAIEFQYYLV